MNPATREQKVGTSWWRVAWCADRAVAAAGALETIAIEASNLSQPDMISKSANPNHPLLSTHQTLSVRQPRISLGWREVALPRAIPE